MESYRFITRTLAAITITGFALAANPSLGAVAIDIQDKSSDLNL